MGRGHEGVVKGQWSRGVVKRGVNIVAAVQALPADDLSARTPLIAMLYSGLSLCCSALDSRLAKSSRARAEAQEQAQ